MGDARPDDFLAIAIGNGGTPSNLSLPDLETVIERGQVTFIEVGRALMEIRDRRLYRETHATFEAYCRERWGWGRNYANKHIAAAKAVDALGTSVPTPQTEGEARRMRTQTPAKLPAAKRAEQITTLAAEGNTADQIAAQIGVGTSQVRSLARAHSITLPDTMIGKRRQLDAAHIVRETVNATDGLAFGLRFIDMETLDFDSAEAGEMAAALETSLRSLRSLLGALRRFAS